MDAVDEIEAAIVVHRNHDPAPECRSKVAEEEGIKQDGRQHIQNTPFGAE